jgi:IS30 family transposase
VPTIDAGVQIFFCDHASPWQRPTNVKKGAEVARSTQLW